ncbi:LysM domain-containing protein, partial [Leptospira selangorensis]
MRKLRFNVLICLVLANLTISAKQNPPNVYRVTKGDTWYGIARKLNVTPNALAKLNGRTLAENLFENESLRIPKNETIQSVSSDKKEIQKISYPLLQREKIQKKFSELTYDPHKGI